MQNTLYYGDNLPILRQYIASESVDLVYLDPPFNSNRSYNVLFREEGGDESQAQIQAFDDSWHWNNQTEAVYNELVTDIGGKVGEMIGALHGVIGTNQMMAYLVMMAVRLVELHRVLKPTGSLYLHCDPTASHYLKIVLDSIFGVQNFRNEVVWKRKTGRGETNHKSNRFGNSTDTLLFYSKSDDNLFNSQFNSEAEGYQEYIEKFYRYTDSGGRRYRIDNLASPSPRPNLIYLYKGYKPPQNGWAISKEKMEAWDIEGRLHFPKDPNGRIQRKRYLDESKGKPVQNLWDDIEMVSSQAAERLGYPTQKPVALLERIINASSNPGDVVLDPFCGCGTAIAAAEKLGRKWIGIDITHLAVALIKYRMTDMFPGATFAVVGEPEDYDSAMQLAHDDRYQFQWWALSLVKARPLGGDAGSRTGKRGSDQGIDGVINFIDDGTGKPKRALVQVKSGHVKSGDIRDLIGTLDREKAQIGLFVTLEEPSSAMLKEAASSGLYRSPGWQQDYPRVQILTVAELLAGAKVEMPPAFGTFKQAPKSASEGPEQGRLGL